MIECIVKNAFNFWSDKTMCQSNFDMVVPIQLQNIQIDDGQIDYIAAWPMESRMSFSGSGLPFVNYDQALDNTPNSGSVAIQPNKDIQINILYPNSFYIHSHLVNPTLFLRYKVKNEYKYNAIVLGNNTPFRSLFHPKERDQGPTFYKNFNDYPVLSQEQILYNSAYPNNNTQPIDFWGLKPSH